jgi:GNAT superfamily N-acetyltransferase
MAGVKEEQTDSTSCYWTSQVDGGYMHVNVGQLSKQAGGRASRLLTRAFAEDPIITHFFHDRLRRRIAFPAFFQAVLEELLPSSQVYAAHHDGGLVGVAAWMPPGGTTPNATAQKAAARYQRLVHLMFPRAAQGLFRGFAALEHYHPGEPHWYLAFVGVDPAMQNRGIGQKLLAPMLQIADETSTLCYLETPFPRTHAFYERLGFVRHAEHHPFIGAPQGVVTFLRRPR